MADEKRHLDNEPNLGVSPRFASDLGELFASEEAIPDSVDRAIAEAARRHLRRSPRKLWWVRWSVPATAAAAILLGVSLWWFKAGAGLHTAHEGAPQATSVSLSQADIDRSGQVNILDAFTLARHIEAKQPVERTWDLNGDGLIDHRDVDAAAQAAVRLGKGV